MVDKFRSFKNSIQPKIIFRNAISILLILFTCFCNQVFALPKLMKFPSGEAVILDNTPPAMPIVLDDGEFTNSHYQLHASWSSQDPETGVSEYQYSIGTALGLADVVNWTSTGTNAQVTATGLSLIPNQSYYFNVKAKNGANLWSGVGSSDGIAVLNQAPQITSLQPQNNSTFTEQDIVNITVQAQDPNQDPLEYRYLVNGNIIQDWTVSNTYSWQTQAGDVGLKTIYVEVRDEHGAIASAQVNAFLYRKVPGPAQ